MKPDKPLDPEFDQPLPKVNPRQRPGRLLAGFWVALALYSPFALIPMGLNDPNDWWRGWILLWPILPGFAPAVWLTHPNDSATWLVSASVTLGLWLALTLLGATGMRRLGVAITLSLLISIPTACFVCAGIAF